MNTKNLIDKFILNSDSFFKDLELESIDNKHQLIVEEAYKQLNINNNKFSFRSWKAQTDLDIPAQFSLNYFKYQKLPRSIFKYIFRKIFKRTEDYFLRNLIKDEVEIINLLNGGQLLIDNPVHLSPGVQDVYNIGKTSVNLRWMRYIYILNNILQKNLLPDNGVWADIGSFYGGAQGLVKKYKPNSKLILIDFNHQLCRSYLYLSQLYPEANHILPNEAKQLKNTDPIKSGSIL